MTQQTNAARLKERCEPGLSLAFQPIVSASNPTEIAFHEALIRLNGAAGTGAGSVESMIAAIEDGPGMADLDHAVLSLAERNLDRIPGRRLTVNVSQTTIREDASGYIERAAKLGRRADRLIIEITEGRGVEQPVLLKRFIDRAQARGLSIAIDDARDGHAFGCPDMIRFLAPDIVKLCGRFTRHSFVTGNHQWLGRAVETAREIGAEVVAEWMDGDDVLAFMQQFQPDYYQGWMFGRPRAFN